MKQNNKLEYHIPLILAAILLSAVSIPMTAMPYCYSEASLMTDSIMYLNSNGLGLVYNNGYVEFPNFFALIYYGIAKILGTGAMMLHITAMAFSAISMIIAYKFGKFFFSVQAGVMSAALMCVQNVYMAQTGLVLPQMMLNACILGGMHLFFREKYLGSTILMTLAALTDISGVVASGILIIAYLRIQYRDWSSGKSVLLAMPIIIWIAVQSASLMVCGKFSMRYNGTSLSNFVENIYFVSAAQNRFAITGVILIVLIVNKIKKTTQYFVRDMGANSVMMILGLYICNSLTGNTESWNLAAISLLAVLAGCAISTLPISYPNKYIITCLLMVTSMASILTDHSVDDASVRYKTKIKVDLRTVNMIESSANEGDYVLCDQNFKRLISNPELGYAQGIKLTLLDITDDEGITESMADWAIYSNFDTLSTSIRESENLVKNSTIFINNYSNEIYKRKR